MGQHALVRQAWYESGHKGRTEVGLRRQVFVSEQQPFGMCRRRKSVSRKACSVGVPAKTPMVRPASAFRLRAPFTVVIRPAPSIMYQLRSQWAWADGRRLAQQVRLTLLNCVKPVGGGDRQDSLLSGRADLAAGTGVLATAWQRSKGWPWRACCVNVVHHSANDPLSVARKMPAKSGGE
jgi:hypothetical protein